VVSTLALVYASQESESLIPLYAALKNSSDAALDEFSVDDGVGVRSALDLPGDDFVTRELLAQDEGED
jgi:hypothetical protein